MNVSGINSTIDLNYKSLRKKEDDKVISSGNNLGEYYQTDIVTVDKRKFYTLLDTCSFTSTCSNHSGDAIGVQSDSTAQVKNKVKKLFEQSCTSSNNSYMGGGSF